MPRNESVNKDENVVSHDRIHISRVVSDMIVYIKKVRITSTLEAQFPKVERKSDECIRNRKRRQEEQSLQFCRGRSKEWKGKHLQNAIVFLRDSNASLLIRLLTLMPFDVLK
jgi:hypothetical protein